VEKSGDAVHFTKIATLPAENKDGKYAFTDPDALSGVVYYRVRLADGGNYKFTRVVALNASQLQFEIKSVVNPFDNTVTFDAFTPADKQVTVSILDCYGRQLASGTRYLYQGYNKVDITGLGALSKGFIS